MSQSPALTSELLNNSPNDLSTDAIYVNAERNPYHSTISLELRRTEHTNLIGSRVSQFCEQQKLLADKDLRIQELLMEIRSYKDEATFLISQLQQTVTELLNNNRFLEADITELLKEKNDDKTLIAEKDQLIEELMSKNFNAERNKDKSLYENLAEIENDDQIAEKQQINMSEGIDGGFESKENILEELEKPVENIEAFKDRLKILEEKDKNFSFFFESAFRLIYSNEEQVLKEFLNQPQDFIISMFLKELKELQQENTGLKELNERQAINIIDLEKVVEQQICERRQILDERNKLRNNFDSLQKEINQNFNFNELNKKLIKTEEEKKIAEFELFKLKMNLEEEKNTTSLDFRRMVESIGEDERENNHSPSTIEERAESEEESSRNSVVFGLKEKIDQLQQILNIKDARLIELEDRYKKYTVSFGKIFELSNDFNETFCPFIEKSHIKTGEICDRIDKHLKEKFEVEKKATVLPNNIQNLPINSGLEYCESLIPSTIVSELI